MTRTSTRTTVTLAIVGGLITVAFAVLTVRLLADAAPPAQTGSAEVFVRLPSRYSFGPLAFAKLHLNAYVAPSNGDSTRYLVTACAPTVIEFALVLRGNAQLAELSTGVPGTRLKMTSDSQIISWRGRPGPCLSGQAYAGTGFDASGIWQARFYSARNGEGAFSFPSVGSLLVHTPTQVEGLPGWWSTPPFLTVNIHGGPLGPNDRLDLAKPETTAGSTGLTWSGRDYIRPVARWTNISVDRRNQQLLIIYSILIGVGAALLAASAQQGLERATTRSWRRKQRKPTSKSPDARKSGRD